VLETTVAHGRSRAVAIERLVVGVQQHRPRGAALTPYRAYRGGVAFMQLVSALSLRALAQLVRARCATEEIKA
jgi:hypothetical protein